MTHAIYWFRNDLRLHDNPSLLHAIANASTLLPIYCKLRSDGSPWLTERIGRHRHAFIAQALKGLKLQLQNAGSDLVCLDENPVTALIDTARRLNIQHIFCEDIAAPEEQAEVNALRKAGLTVTTHWQSSLLNPEKLPFPVTELPAVFTQFRHAIERAGCLPEAPRAAPKTLPPLPADIEVILQHNPQGTDAVIEPRSAFPYHDSAFQGDELSALAHLKAYFSGDLAQHYKLTRNGLIGTTYSTKFSPWLAIGALSPRMVFAALRQHEHEQGANDSTYWIWFELLWRDYFRFLHLQYGTALYRARGLAQSAPRTRHTDAKFQRWCDGNTGEPFVDAGMRELAASGYLSNRMRQVVASYLVHDLGCDYRAGAAWFEQQLVDYDPYSNQGNWLYGAGLGIDPRGGRRFNPDKQTREHDADGAYRSRWGTL